MHNDQLISIVLTTYNGEKYLPELLDSILNQTYTNIEIIAVDDCSTDNTLQILHQYQQQTTALKVYSNPENLGYIKNFEKGARLASGNYIAFCDQDDIWLPEKLAVLKEEMDKGQYIVYCDSEFVDASGKSMHKKLSDIRNQIDFDNPLMFTIGNSAPGHAMIIRREIIEKSLPFPDNMVHDRWISFICTFYGPLKFINTPLVKYRQHDANSTSGTEVAKENRKEEKTDEKTLRRERMKDFYERSPDGKFKTIFKQLHDSYSNFTLKNNLKRMLLFFRYRDEILAWKKHSAFHRWIFCFKMFYQIK